MELLYRPYQRTGPTLWSMLLGWVGTLPTPCGSSRKWWVLCDRLSG
jgi:hypothetical protein